MDAAAHGMAHDDDLRHLQNPNRELDRGAGAVECGVLLVGRNEVGDVADDEKLAGTHVEHHGGIDTAVGAGNDERFRALTALRQSLEPFAPAGPDSVTEAPIAAEKIFHGLQITASVPRRQYLPSRKRGGQAGETGPTLPHVNGG